MPRLVESREEMYAIRANDEERAKLIQQQQDELFRDFTEEHRQRLFQEVGQIIMDQRMRLLQFREVTSQSATIDSDSVISELLAALVIGNPGRCRKGKDSGEDLIARNEDGDLIDENRPTEQVKKGYRLDPMIDFRMSGTISDDGKKIALNDGFPESFNPRLAAVLCEHGSNVQPLKVVEDRLIADEMLWRLAGKALQYDVDNNIWKLCLGRGHRVSEPYEDGRNIIFDLKQERGKLNFGKKTVPELRALLRSQTAIVHYHHDRRGRPVIAIFILKPSEQQIEEYIEAVEGFDKCSNTDCDFRQIGYDRQTVNCPGCNRPNTVEVQPYLFSPADSARDELKSDYRDLGAHLVAHGHLGRDGFEVDLFQPTEGYSLEEGGAGEDLLLRMATDEQCPDLSIPPLEAHERTARNFVEQCIHGFYRDILPYLDCANMTRNLIGGTLAEHLQTLVHGGFGTRSGSNGPDIVEGGMPEFQPPQLMTRAGIDNHLQVSEVKLATGHAGDSMGVEDGSTRLNLGSKRDVMCAWESLLPVRIVHEEIDGQEFFRVACFAPAEGQMHQFREDVAQYFDVEHPTSSNMQYHAGEFDRNWFGNENHRLDCERTFEYKEPFY